MRYTQQDAASLKKLRAEQRKLVRRVRRDVAAKHQSWSSVARSANRLSDLGYEINRIRLAEKYCFVIAKYGKAP